MGKEGGVVVLEKLRGPQNECIGFTWKLHSSQKCLVVCNLGNLYEFGPGADQDHVIVKFHSAKFYF